MEQPPEIWHALRNGDGPWVETPRLQLRPPRQGDAAAFADVIAEAWEDLHLWMEWAADESPITVEQTAAVIEEMAAHRTAATDSAFLLVDPANGDILGTAGLHRIDWSIPRLEIGYWLAPRHQGQGLMTEAVTALTRFAFKTLNAQRIEIRCAAANPRSAAVARRAGYLHEATLANDRRHHLTGKLDATEIHAKLRP